MSDTPCAAWKESRGEQAPAGPRPSEPGVMLDEQGSSEGLGGDQQGEGVGAYVMRLKKKGRRK